MPHLAALIFAHLAEEQFFGFSRFLSHHFGCREGVPTSRRKGLWVDGVAVGAMLAGLLWLDHAGTSGPWRELLYGFLHADSFQHFYLQLSECSPGGKRYAPGAVSSVGYQAYLWMNPVPLSPWMLLGAAPIVLNYWMNSRKARRSLA